MWQKCICELCYNSEIKYKISDDFFYVNCVLDSTKISPGSQLMAVFYNNGSYKEFEIGIFDCKNGQCFIEKKYSVAYLCSNNIDTEKFSHFVINTSDGKIINAYPCLENEADESLERAKNTLNSLKQSNDPETAKKIVENIFKRTSIYKKTQLPFLSEFKWYVINNQFEFFDLSAIKHLICCEENAINKEPWYFGVGSDERIYSVAVKCKNNMSNPLVNASDCAVKFSVPNTNEAFFVVGILLLDDGQYFCRLS